MKVNMPVFKFRLWVGPTRVKHYADFFRLYFAGHMIFEGTENVWLYLSDTPTFASCPELPQWIIRDMRYYGIL